MITTFLSLMDVMTGSDVEKTKFEWIYRRDGAVRAVVGVENGNLHGKFRVFYPDGRLWVAGSYSEGEANPDWECFLPDGSKVLDEDSAIINGKIKF